MLPRRVQVSAEQKKPGIKAGFQKGVAASILFFRCYPVFVAFLTCGLNHLFSNQDFAPVFIENCTPNMQVGVGSNEWYLIAAVVQAHGLSPHQVSRLRLPAPGDHGMTSLQSTGRLASPAESRINRQRLLRSILSSSWPRWS